MFLSIKFYLVVCVHKIKFNIETVELKFLLLPQVKDLENVIFK